MDDMEHCFAEHLRKPAIFRHTNVPYRHCSAKKCWNPQFFGTTMRLRCTWCARRVHHLCTMCISSALCTHLVYKSTLQGYRAYTLYAPKCTAGVQGCQSRSHTTHLTTPVLLPYTMHLECTLGTQRNLCARIQCCALALYSCASTVRCSSIIKI